MSIGGGGGGEDGDDDDGDDERRYESGEAGRAQWQPRRTSHRDFRFRRVTTARRTERETESLVKDDNAFGHGDEHQGKTVATKWTETGDRR